MKITYQPRWKEEFVGTRGENRFVVQMTMGNPHVFFPKESTWNTNPPDWASGLWNDAKTAAQQWCEENNVPFTIDDQAYVEFE
ncbi:MAG: hypothetical protein JXX14_26265 [Deltaproteobacteria bacterium]|nr:hypothetical protein [Deltaproteobacteria bacterium]